VDQTSRIFAAAAGQGQPFATIKFANMLIDPNATNDIAVYGNIVVVVSSSASGINPNLCYSTDGGTNWIPKQILDSSNNQYSFTSVTVNTSTGQFFAVAGTSVLTSTNGNIWSLASTLGVSANVITFFPSGPYQYVILSTSTTVLTSSDGITWTTRSALPGAGNFAAFGNSIFIVGGNNFLRRTADFITYTTPTINELTGGLTEADFNYVGGVYKGTTFIVSAYVNATSLVTYCWKSTNNGVNFSLSNTSEGYYENANLGLFVNSPDGRSQSVEKSYGGNVYTISTAPNRGDALTFSGATYSLRTRKNAVITTTTGSLGTNGLSAVNSTDTANVAPITNSVTRSTTGLGLGTISLAYSTSGGGAWRITYTSTSISGGSSVVLAPTPNFNINILNKYQASGEAITGYPFVLNNTFIVFFPNAFYDIGSGTRYNGTTAYYSTDLTTWTQVTTLPSSFNISGGSSSFGASYKLVIVRGEFGGGGYVFAWMTPNVSGFLVGMYSPTLATFTEFNFFGPPCWAPVYSANDGTGSAGWVVMVGGNDAINPDPASTVMVAEPTNNYASWPNRYFVIGLNGASVLRSNFTDASYINGQFRFFCTFTNLVGTLVPGVISMTTAGVFSHTVISGFSNIKVLGRVNNTLYVINTGTGEVLSSTDGTTYTSRFFWNQPFVSGMPVYLDTASTAYTSGPLLDSTTFRPLTNQTNWFTSADGSTWTKAALTNPNSSAQSVRGVLPNKYALATSGNYVGIAKGFNASSSGYLPVATSGSSLSNMPYKRLVPYAVPNFVTSPVFYNSTLSQYYSVSAYFGTSATSTNGLLWSLNSGTFNVDTSTTANPASADSFFYVYVASGKILYRSSVSNRYYEADLSTPTTYSLINFPTIGTTYTGNRATNVAFDGTTYMICSLNTVSGALSVLTSSNGATWSNSTLVTSNLYNVRPGLVAGATGSFLVYADQGLSDRAAFTSNNGSTWTTLIPLNVGNICYGVVYGNSTYVAFGSGTTGPGYISYSTNGTTFTTVYTAAERIYAGIYTNLGSGFFIAGGNAGIGGSAIVYSNTAGTTWSNATVGGSPITGVAVTQIIDGGASASPRFVALLFTGSTQALTSDDGVTWSVVSMVGAFMTPFSLPGSNYNNFVNGRWTFGSYNNGIINKPHLILTNG